MKILIVEDSRSEREILKYLLESRFQNAAKFREAGSLDAAFGFLDRGDIDCVILDLQLPDSAGRETFEKLVKRHPEVPVVVMTNNKDRELALDMIQKGAQEFVIKNYTDEEELFRRVLFAIEKHRRTVRVPTEDAATVHRLEKAKARMLTAQEEGQGQLMQMTTVETTSAIADLAKRMFTELQTVNTNMTQQKGMLEEAITTSKKLKVEMLEGTPNQPSMRSQVELLTNRVNDMERREKGRVPSSRVSPRWLLLVVLIIVGTIASAGVGGYLAIKGRAQSQHIQR